MLLGESISIFLFFSSSARSDNMFLLINHRQESQQEFVESNSSLHREENAVGVMINNCILVSLIRISLLLYFL